MWKRLEANILLTHCRSFYVSQPKQNTTITKTKHQQQQHPTHDERELHHNHSIHTSSLDLVTRTTSSTTFPFQRLQNNNVCSNVVNIKQFGHDS